VKRGTVGEGEKGMGRKGGGSAHSQPGIRADRDRATTEEGFQVSKGEFKE
jgi:hypothetical protein